MTTIRLDSSSWDDARDGAFFRLTARLFSPAFCAGASVLLASYDGEHVPGAPAPQIVRQQGLVPGAGLAAPRQRSA